MGKSHRHKKLNRQEKAKTGLKGAKKLAKAANVVNPTLKVKRIVIREQLNSSASTSTSTPSGQQGGSGEAPVTRRHQTLPELLSALHHHNTNLRKDALLGLHELVTGVYNHNTTFLQRNLDKILERVAALTSDLEGVVRRENLKVAEAIFCRVAESEVSPYWSLILAHLQCTLTHLHPTVRFSTLPFFHLLVTYLPNLVATSARALLTSFLGLISSSNPNAKLKGSTAAHLKVEISGQKDQVQERLKVFALIDATLQLRARKNLANAQSLATPRQLSFRGQEIELVDNQEPQDEDEEIVIFSNVEEAKSKKNKSNYGEETGLMYTFGYDTFSTRNYSSMSLGEILGVGVGIRENSDDENQFWPRFASSCLSCLIETWIESCPSASASSTIYSLSSTALKPSNSSKNKKKGNGGGKQVESLTKSLTSRHSGGSGTPGVNLNPASVEILKNLVSVMVQIVSLLDPAVDEQCGTGTEDGNSTARDELLQVLRDSQGSELKKYFFSHLPYGSIQDSQKQTLTTINLQLFRLATQLGLMDKGLKVRMETITSSL